MTALPHRFSLDGRGALVTGGAKGIGAAIRRTPTEEQAKRGVRVTALAPGYTATERTLAGRSKAGGHGAA